MSQWDGCPAALFDLYMEVGEIRLIGETDCACIEVWISSCFARGALRQECAQIRRRSIWGILKQILKLADGRQVCLVFQCDDESSWGNDTENWSSAIWPLLRELQSRGKLVCSILFTRKTGDEIRQRSGSSFHRERDRDDYIALYRNLHILVTGRANRYADSAGSTVYCASEESKARFDWLLNENQP